MVSHVHNFQAFHINTCKLGKTVTLVHDINLKKMHTQGRVCVSLLFANNAKKEKKIPELKFQFPFPFPLPMDIVYAMRWSGDNGQ